MCGARRFLGCVVSVVLVCSAFGCKSGGLGGINGDTKTEAAYTGPEQYPAGDPAAANLAPTSAATDNTGVPPSEYPQGYVSRRAHRQAHLQPASTYSDGGRDYAAQQDEYADPYSSGNNYDDYSDYQPAAEYAPQPPPELVAYNQPPCPGENYIWTPGHWAYDGGQGYFWVPGAWVAAPFTGALWTPGWWHYEDGRYGWHRGYWAHHVGYYGGINYGYGYTGYGYQGGYWQGDRFAYNRTVTNVNTTVIQNVYNYKIINIRNDSRTSFNGGIRGVHVQPRPAEIEVMHEQHVPPMATQQQVIQQAKQIPQNFAREDKGHPAMPVVAQPLRADNNVRAPEPLRTMARATGEPIPPGNNGPGQPRPANAYRPGEARNAAPEPSVQVQHVPVLPRSSDSVDRDPERPGPNHPQPEQAGPIAQAHPPQQPAPQQPRPQPARPAPTPTPTRPQPQQPKPEPARPAPSPAPSKPENQPRTLPSEHSRQEPHPPSAPAEQASPRRQNQSAAEQRSSPSRNQHDQHPK